MKSNYTLRSLHACLIQAVVVLSIALLYDIHFSAITDLSPASYSFQVSSPNVVSAQLNATQARQAVPFLGDFMGKWVMEKDNSEDTDEENLFLLLLSHAPPFHPATIPANQFTHFLLFVEPATSLYLLNCSLLL